MFPNPADISDNRPLSVVSHVTDEFTEYGEGGEFSTPSRAQFPQNTGEGSGSRPGSSQTGVSSHRAWSHATPHRGGLSYAGSVGAGSTRPPTAHSRTHAPSLTASAFYRPMSSQRLQAQRSQRPPSAMTQSTEATQGLDDEDSPRRVRTATQPNATRPLSITTDITEQIFPGGIPEVTTVPDLPEGAARNIAKQEQFGRNRADSNAPLQNPGISGVETKIPARLDMNHLKGTTALPSQRSPISLANLISNRHSKSSLQLRQQGHEKLPSDVSTPNKAEATKETIKNQLGKNHEYFEGNTVFCYGGRFQNTRDRPVNIATGFLILLPVALFLGFS
jgi:palmitoyltransferase ZDHHC9/14/18